MTMQTIIKSALTAGVIAALAWSLLFWGKSESLAHSGHYTQQDNIPQTAFFITPQYPPVW
jgi:hypothetical protein